MIEQVTGTIDAWSVEQCTRSEYIIWGNVTGHYNFPDGCSIHTSGILNKAHPVGKLKEGDLVNTRNSTYKLGRSLSQALNEAKVISRSDDE